MQNITKPGRLGCTTTSCPEAPLARRSPETVVSGLKADRADTVAEPLLDR